MFVVLICLLILLACLAVKLLFKRRLGLRVVRDRSAGGSRTLIVRTPVTTTDEAQRALARHRFYFLTTNPATLAYQTFAGKNITMFQSHPYFTKEEKEKLLDRWVKKVRLSGE